jgi:hypothetical protein
MTPRQWDCFQCGSRFATDADGELVEYARRDQWCLGCQRLLAILQDSALWHWWHPPEAEALTPAIIAERLQRGRTLRPAFDYAKAAANDRDED